MNNQQFWIYILLCSNGHYYTGYTTDMARRYKEHLRGTSKCKYTRSFKPIKIAQCWRVLDTKENVMLIERFIKTLNRSEKEQFISDPTQLTKLFLNAYKDVVS